MEHHARLRGRALIAIVTVMFWASCGDRSSSSPDASSGAGQGASGGSGGSDSGSAGAAADGGSGGIVIDREGGRGPRLDVVWDTRPSTCIDPAPVVDPSSGYVRCQNGLVHRTMKATCPSRVPRPDVITIDAGLSNCRMDSDCADLGPFGHCAPVDVNGRVYVGCFAGCINDEQCRAGEICVCGDPVGQCKIAKCTSDADCASPDLFCASHVLSPGCPHIAFACQSYDDACAVDADCPPLTQCSLADGWRRACRVRECVFD